jgi:hypothetical protein
LDAGRPRIFWRVGKPTHDSGLGENEDLILHVILFFVQPLHCGPQSDDPDSFIIHNERTEGSVSESVDTSSLLGMERAGGKAAWKWLIANGGSLPRQVGHIATLQ